MLSQTASVSLQIPGQVTAENFLGPIQDGLSTPVYIIPYPTSAASPDNVVNTITGTITVGWYGGKTLGTTAVTASASGFTSTSSFTDPTYTLNVADAGSAIASGPYTGDYILVAVYGGDSNFSATSPVQAADYAQILAGTTNYPDNVEPFIVQFQPHIAVTVQPVTTAPGAVITPSPQVTVYNANGTIDTAQNLVIDPTLDSSSTGTGSLSSFTNATTVNGVATFPNLSITTAGEYVLNFTDQLADVTTSVPFAVSTGGGGTTTTTTTSLAVAASSPSIAFGGGETVTATITPATSGANAVTGTVTFKLADGTSLGSATVSGGIASLAITSLPVGDDLISASYSGDSHFSTSNTTTAAAVEVTSSGTTGTTGNLPTAITKSSLPTSIVAGAKVHGAFSVAITNSTSAISFGLDDIIVYASTDGAIDSSSTPVASLRRRLKVAAGTTTKPIPLPAKFLTFAAGDYTLLVQTTDYTGSVSTSSGGSAFAVAPAQIILAATAGAVKPAAVKAGRAVSLVLTLTNTGNVKASGQMKIAIGLSTDAATLAMSLTTTTRAPVTNPGGTPTTKVPISFRIPKTVPAGTYYPYFVLMQGTTELTVIGTVPFTVG